MYRKRSCGQMVSAIFALLTMTRWQSIATGATQRSFRTVLRRLPNRSVRLQSHCSRVQSYVVRVNFIAKFISVRGGITSCVVIPNRQATRSSDVEWPTMERLSGVFNAAFNHCVKHAQGYVIAATDFGFDDQENTDLWLMCLTLPWCLFTGSTGICSLS